MSGWRQKGGGDTWRAWWKQFDGNMTQLGQQVRGEFTPLSSYKCEDVMSVHTPAGSSQRCLTTERLVTTSLGRHKRSGEGGSACSLIENAARRAFPCAHCVKTSNISLGKKISTG